MKANYINDINPEIIEKNKATIKNLLSTDEGFNPDPDCCPPIAVYWQQKTNGKAFHLLDGKYEIVSPKSVGTLKTVTDYRKETTGNYNTSNVTSKNIVVCSGKDAKVAYAKYYPDLEMLSVGVLTINIRKIPEEKRRYHFVERYFLFKNCPVPFNVNGNIAFESKGGKFYSLGFVSFMQHEVNRAITHALFAREIEKFTGVENAPNYRWTKWTPYIFGEYYKSMYPRNTSKASEDITDIINNLPVVDLDKLRKEFPKVPVEVKNYWNDEYHTEYQDTIWTFNILNDKYCVIRQFGGYFHFMEQSRVLIDSDGKVTIFEPAQLLTGETVFRISSATKVKAPDDRTCFFKGFEDMFKFKRLFYISSIIQDDEIMTQTKSAILKIIYTLRWPFLEQFYKAGYKYISNILMNETGKSNVKYLFGGKGYSDSANIYEISGMNKHQLQLVDKMFEEKAKNPKGSGLGYTRSIVPWQVIDTVRFVSGVENLSSLTDKDSDFYFEQAKNLNRVHVSYDEFLYHIGTNNSVYFTLKKKDKVNGFDWVYRDKNRNEEVATKEQVEKDRKNLIKLMRLQDKTTRKGENEDVFRIFSDAFNLFKQISNTNRPNIDLYGCKDVNELHRYHNMLIEINVVDKETRSKEEQERLNKLAAKLYDQRKEKFEFADDNFSIVVPKEMNKITKEGVYLHHCVGGYVNRVAEGHTNIVFLRKNEEPEIPFFTIEVSNGNEIIQIHGLYNRWLGNEPEAVKFVIDWIHEKKIKCPVNIVLNKGQGYSSSTNKLNAKDYDLEGKKYV